MVICMHVEETKRQTRLRAGCTYPHLNRGAEYKRLAIVD